MDCGIGGDVLLLAEVRPVPAVHSNQTHVLLCERGREQGGAVQWDSLAGLHV